MMLDPMDALVQKLESETKTPKVVVPNQTIVPQQQPEQQQPEPKMTVEEREKQADELMKMIEPKPEEVKQVEPKQEKKIPELLKKVEDKAPTVEELEELYKYMADLEDNLTQSEFEKRTTKVERDQFEQLLQKEQSRQIEMGDKLRSLEWELKQINSQSAPEELKNLADYYRLNKEKPSNYVK